MVKKIVVENVNIGNRSNRYANPIIFMDTHRVLLRSSVLPEVNFYRVRLHTISVLLPLDSAIVPDR